MKKEKRERIPNENELESFQIPTENPYVRFRFNEINETNPLPNNFYKHISENKDIIKLISQLATCINATRKDVNIVLETFAQYNSLWQTDPDEQLEEFLSKKPHLSEFECRMKSYENLRSQINCQPEYFPIGPFAIFTDRLKYTFNQEIREWIVLYGQSCKAQYEKQMKDLFIFIEDIEKRLAREIKDLDDIRLIMLAVKDLRENEIRIDMSIIPIEESYAMLQTHGIQVPREELDQADSLRYRWEKLQTRSVRREFILNNKKILSFHFLVEYDLAFA